MSESNLPSQRREDSVEMNTETKAEKQKQGYGQHAKKEQYAQEIAKYPFGYSQNKSCNWGKINLKGKYF